jgi:hypothetical protein
MIYTDADWVVYPNTR